MAVNVARGRTASSSNDRVFVANHTVIWWNVWLVNFDGGERQQQLHERLRAMHTEHRPSVFCLQEVVEGEGVSLLRELFSDFGYVSYFETLQVRPDGRRFGILIAVAGRLEHGYQAVDCGAFGDRRTILQYVHLGTRAGGRVALGNTHWLMMRPVFELHRLVQMRRIAKAVDAIATAGSAFVLGGDLNTAAHHPYMLWLRRRYCVSPNVGPTWWLDATSSWVKAALDHLVCSEAVVCEVRSLERWPSDHAPLIATVAAGDLS